MIIIGQIIISIVLIILILLQERSSGLSGLFGGDNGGAYQTRRGMEKGIFAATVVCAILFVVFAIINLTA